MSTENPFKSNNTSLEPHEFDKDVLKIPLQDLDLDTHGTFGEHAIKERGAWEEYLQGAKEQGATFDVEDPFTYYLEAGSGRFYRAYMSEYGGPMVAGLTVRTNEKKGFMLDSTYNVSDKSAAASAYQALIKKFFQEFSGILPVRGTANLTIPIEKLQKNSSLARAVFYFGLVRGSDFIIPMPGIAPLPFRNISEEEKGNLRKIIAQKSITGLLPYQEDIGDASTVTEEYYREGILVGKAAITHMPIEDEYEQEVKIELQDANGRSLQFDNDIVGDTIRRVKILKTLAKNNPLVADLILG